MFTGLVEDVGTIVDSVASGRGQRISVRTTIPLADVRIGDSIAVHGACLTAEAIQGDRFDVVASWETLTHTTLGTFQTGTKVHLERALALGGRLDGHLVSGHVDATGRVVRSEEASESWTLVVDVGADLQRYVARKGSVTVDGVSLTVNRVAGSQCHLNLVPHTARSTCLAGLAPGDLVNVEVDLLARYVERLLESPSSSGGLSLEHLRNHGFAR